MGTASLTRYRCCNLFPTSLSDWEAGKGRCRRRADHRAAQMAIAPEQYVVGPLPVWARGGYSRARPVCGYAETPVGKPPSTVSS
jgi:hypothetical protein